MAQSSTPVQALTRKISCYDSSKQTPYDLPADKAVVSFVSVALCEDGLQTLRAVCCITHLLLLSELCQCLADLQLDMPHGLLQS